MNTTLATSVEIEWARRVLARTDSDVLSELVKELRKHQIEWSFEKLQFVATIILQLRKLEVEKEGSGAPAFANDWQTLTSSYTALGTQIAHISEWLGSGMELGEIVARVEKNLPPNPTVSDVVVALAQDHMIFKKYNPIPRLPTEAN